MPEGPELHLSSRFVNKSCEGRIFTGKVVKSPVHKSCEVPFEAKAYTICALSRGKEMQLILTQLDDDALNSTNCKLNNVKKLKIKPKVKVKNEPDDEANKNCTTKILFRFGMSGKFEFTSPDKVHKHAHLKFYTGDNGEEPMVLSHVDVRRFGRWEVDADWSKQRGPDPMFEYQNFRSNVLSNLVKAAFNQPICEVLLNQKYFNGIGNYLRAEILYRLGIPPFEKARSVLEGLSLSPPDAKPGKNIKKGSREEPDILHLCHTVPLEVVNMIGGGGYDPEGKSADYTAFSDWLQCYYQDGMSNMVDHNARTIWYKGPAGPMAPKEGKSRSKKSKKRKVTTKNDRSMKTDDAESPPKKSKGSANSAKTTSVTTKKARKSTKSHTVPKQKSTPKTVAGNGQAKQITRARKKSANSDVTAKKKAGPASSKRKASAPKQKSTPKTVVGNGQPKETTRSRKKSPNSDVIAKKAGAAASQRRTSVTKSDASSTKQTAAVRRMTDPVTKAKLVPKKVGAKKRAPRQMPRTSKK